MAFLSNRQGSRGSLQRQPKQDWRLVAVLLRARLGIPCRYCGGGSEHKKAAFFVMPLPRE